MIITTNLKLVELKNLSDLAHARIYARILECCAPILFAGKNFQKENAGTTRQAAKDFVNHKTTDCFAGRRIPVWRKKNHIEFMRNGRREYDKIDKNY